MLKLPQALDWTRLDHIGTRIAWTGVTYNHLKSEPTASSNPTANGTEWHRLPFHPVQLDKFPQRSGVYAFAYTYLCLAFPEQEIILYVGEAENLHSRLHDYITES